MVAIQRAVPIPPAGLFESGQEVGVKPIDVGELISVVILGRLG